VPKKLADPGIAEVEDAKKRLIHNNPIISKVLGPSISFEKISG
jgi:hypothetical protein